MALNKDITIKLQKFKRDRRAYFSFLVLFWSFIVTLPAELICNVRPLILNVDGRWYFPALFDYSEQDFGGSMPREPDYKSEAFIRLLEGKPAPSASLGTTTNGGQAPFTLEADDFSETEKPLAGRGAGAPFLLNPDDFSEESATGGANTASAAPTMAETALTPKSYWILWPPVRYDYKHIPTGSITGKVALAAPYATTEKKDAIKIPSSWADGHYLGTDDRGRDVLSRLIYGFRISMIFGLSLAVTGTVAGCFIGGFQGYFGGWIDLLCQRAIEIWGSLPRLYLLIILSSLWTPSLLLLFFILNMTAWMGIAAYIRAEFLKSRNLEYVKAAKAMGISDFQIMRRHILPNSLTPVITFFPFEVTSGILALVSLDFLNLGVPSPSPSMGELLAQGKNNLQAIWIMLPTFAVLTVALTLLTFIGEGIRNAFDPKRS